MVKKGGKKLTPVFSNGQPNGWTSTQGINGGNHVTLVDDQGNQISIGGSVVPIIVATLPTVGLDGVTYLVPSANPTTGNEYDEYIWTSEDKWEFVGSTSGGGGASTATQVAYDNTASGLTATNVQQAINEVYFDSEFLDYRINVLEKITDKSIEILTSSAPTQANLFGTNSTSIASLAVSLNADNRIYQYQSPNKIIVKKFNYNQVRIGASLNFNSATIPANGQLVNFTIGAYNNATNAKLSEYTFSITGDGTTRLFNIKGLFNLNISAQTTVDFRIVNIDTGFAGIADLTADIALIYGDLPLTKTNFVDVVSSSESYLGTAKNQKEVNEQTLAGIAATKALFEPYRNIVSYKTTWTYAFGFLGPAEYGFGFVDYYAASTDVYEVVSGGLKIKKIDGIHQLKVTSKLVCATAPANGVRLDYTIGAYITGTSTSLGGYSSYFIGNGVDKIIDIDFIVDLNIATVGTIVQLKLITQSSAGFINTTASGDMVLAYSNMQLSKTNAIGTVSANESIDGLAKSQKEVNQQVKTAITNIQNAASSLDGRTTIIEENYVTNDTLENRLHNIPIEDIVGVSYVKDVSSVMIYDKNLDAITNGPALVSEATSYDLIEMLKATDQNIIPSNGTQTITWSSANITGTLFSRQTNAIKVNANIIGAKFNASVRYALVGVTTSFKATVLWEVLKNGVVLPNYTKTEVHSASDTNLLISTGDVFGDVLANDIFQIRATITSTNPSATLKILTSSQFIGYKAGAEANKFSRSSLESYYKVQGSNATTQALTTTFQDLVTFTVTKNIFIPVGSFGMAMVIDRTGGGQNALGSLQIRYSVDGTPLATVARTIRFDDAGEEHVTNVLMYNINAGSVVTISAAYFGAGTLDKTALSWGLCGEVV